MVMQALLQNGEGLIEVWNMGIEANDVVAIRKRKLLGLRFRKVSA
jgi:hypothetical protein